MKILYIHRSKNLGDVSIEKVFDIMTSGLDKSIETEKFYVPCHRADPKSIITNLKAVKKITKGTDADVIHIVGDLHYLTLACPRKKTVLTIHDLVGTTRMKGLKKALYLLLWVVLPTLSCAKVVAITEFTKNDVIHYAPWMKNKIDVIPSAVNNTYQFSSKSFNAQCPRILMVGTRVNKNLDRVIEALAGIKCTFDIVGPLSDEQIKNLKRNNIDYINGVRIPESELEEKYKLCDLVLFPSIYEGQGVIILEAQKIGRPVVTSNIEPMISVSGGATCLVDPYNIQDIHRGILKVIESEEYRDRLVKNGLENLKEYEAPVLAQKYTSIYKKICNK